MRTGQKKPLDFTVYVPEGFGTMMNFKIPNVEVTSDPKKILTAEFSGGKEVWAEG